MDAAHCPDALSLVIPAYNEADVIEQAVREAVEALARYFARFEILVVDDGSRDATAALVEALAERYRTVRLLRHQSNQGYGTALRTGFVAARFPLVAFTDADCQFDLDELGAMANLTVETPIVVGWRADRKDPWRRRFLSRGYNWLTRRLLDTRVRDVDCALKVFRRDVLDDLIPRSRGFFVNTEMLTRASRLGHALVEVPVTHRPRLSGDSKVSLWEVPRTLRTLLAFWAREVVWSSWRVSPATVLAARLVSERAAGPVEPLRPASGPFRPAELPAPRRVPA